MRHSMAWPRISSFVRQNVAQPLARCNPQLRLHHVHAGDRLRDGVLHLDARVHLDEVKLAIFVHQKLDRARVLIADLRQAAAQRLPDLLAHLRRHLQRRRFFNQLLMPPLNRALALKQRSHVAMLIGQHLELDVPRLLDELLHVQFAVSERVRRLGKRRMEQVRQLLGVAHDAHAASAAAGLGLQNYRIADFLGPLLRLFDGGNHAVRARQNGHSCLSSSPGAPSPFHPSAGSPPAEAR